MMDDDNKESMTAEKRRFKSMELNINYNDSDLIYDDDEEDYDHINYNNNKSREERLLIVVPVYNTKINDKLEHYDFSINTSVITFKDILLLNGSINISEWKNKITNGVPEECDAINDIINNKILRFPEKDGEEHVIKIHPVGYHFWRIIKQMIKHPNFKLDDDLIRVHKKHYSQWLNFIINLFY